MRIYTVLFSLLASFIFSGCAADGTVRPMPSDMQQSPAEQNQAKLNQALSS